VPCPRHWHHGTRWRVTYAQRDWFIAPRRDLDNMNHNRDAERDRAVAKRAIAVCVACIVWLVGTGPPSQREARQHSRTDAESLAELAAPMLGNADRSSSAEADRRTPPEAGQRSRVMPACARHGRRRMLG